MTDSLTLWIVLVLYLGGMLAIGVWSAKTRVSSMEDMAIAGRNVGPWLIALAVVATWINGVTLIANPGLGKLYGLSAYWCTAGFLVGTIWSGYYLVSKLRQLNIITIPELFDRAYGPKHGLVSLVLVLLRDLGATAGVLGAMATVASDLLGIGLVQSLAITFGVTIVLVVLGGMWAVMITDAIQCVIIFIGSLVLLVVALLKAGGFRQVSADSPDPQLFAHIGSEGGGQQLGWFVMGFAITCSYQTMIQRGLAARSSEIARKGFIYGGFISLVWYMVPYAIGVVGSVLYGEDVKPNDVILTMSRELLNPFWASLIVVTLLAASMSTLDSTVNTIASNFTIDVYRRFLNPAASRRQLFVVSRVNVVVTGVVAAFIYYMVPMMMELFWLGGRIMASALSPVLVGFLFLPSVRRAPRAVMTTFIVGSAAAVASQLLIGKTKVPDSPALIWDLDPILVSLPIAIFTLAIGTWLETRLIRNNAR